MIINHDSSLPLKMRAARLRCADGAGWDREYVATERASIISVLLILDALTIDQGLTTARVAEVCNMTTDGALRLMNKIARVQPIVYDGGVWRWMPE